MTQILQFDMFVNYFWLFGLIIGVTYWRFKLWKKTETQGAEVGPVYFENTACLVT